MHYTLKYTLKHSHSLKHYNVCVCCVTLHVSAIHLTIFRGCSLYNATFRLRIPPGAWIFVCCECRVLSGRGLCDEPITRPEESYRLCCVVVCDLETSRIGAPYIYDISSLRVNVHLTVPSFLHRVSWVILLPS